MNFCCDMCQFYDDERTKNMRVTTSPNYYHKDWKECLLEDCDRIYCPEHRLLYRECETAVVALQGDFDVTNGIHKVVDASGECPACLSRERAKKLERLYKESV